MNKGTFWGVIIVIVLIVAGLLAWRSAGPNGEPMPTNIAFTVSPMPSASLTP